MFMKVSEALKLFGLHQAYRRIETIDANIQQGVMPTAFVMNYSIASPCVWEYFPQLDSCLNF
jgi:hypothetical protein